LRGLEVGQGAGLYNACEAGIALTSGAEGRYPDVALFPAGRRGAEGGARVDENELSCEIFAIILLKNNTQNLMFGN